MPKPLWFSLMTLTLAALLAGCAPSAPLSTPSPTAILVAPTVAPPTVVPPPTAIVGPEGTLTPVTPDPAFPTQVAASQTQEAARQATIVARATASPFATAGPATVQVGRPASAITRRGGLSFQVRLPKDTYLAGEGGQAEVLLRNDGPETLFVYTPDLVVLDEHGHEPEPWPWEAVRLPGMGLLGGPHMLEPGQTVSETRTFQVPPVEQVAGHSYTLWAEASFSRADPYQPEGPDNLWLRLETGPIPLQVIPPDPTQRLAGELQVDRTGWRLRVTDASGQVPPGPLWGTFEAGWYSGATAGPLRDSREGNWSGTWHDDRISQGDGEILVRAWVAAPGYVTAAVAQTVPGTGNLNPTFFGGPEPLRQTFQSLAAAQLALNFPLYLPHDLPDGAYLESVEAETWVYEGGSRSNVHQIYRLYGPPDATWFELTQLMTTEDYTSAGWGRARYAPEAHLVAVGETIGYAIQRFGWWVLDWKADDVGFELQAPVPALSLEDLLAIAAQVRSPEAVH